MPRAPRGYRTINGQIYENTPLKPATVCPYSGHPVTTAQRTRKLRDCPKCGAPDIEWIGVIDDDAREVGKSARYLNTLTWGRHAPGVGRHPALFELDKEIPHVPTDTVGDTPPF